MFLDLDNIIEGRFQNIIVRAIYESACFIPLLGHSTLDSEWVRREIHYALEFNKIIIPLWIDDFTVDNYALPDDIRALATYNGPSLNAEFYELSLERLVNNFLRSILDTH